MFVRLPLPVHQLHPCRVHRAQCLIRLLSLALVLQQEVQAAVCLAECLRQVSDRVLCTIPLLRAVTLLMMFCKDISWLGAKGSV
jgi:hypothetical protein